MLEHLTKPCHQRLQILQWLFSKIDGKLAEMIEANKFTEEGKQTKDLLNMASTLGFCSLDQIDLIKGSASAKDQFEFQRVDKEQLELLCQHLEESLLELKEEIGKFNSCYNNEMKLWCNKQPTAPTRLGPVFERAHTLLNNFESMLVTFDDIHVSSDKIENLKTSETSNQNLRNTSEGFLLDFKELLNTLEVSVNNHRQDSIETDLIKRIFLFILCLVLSLSLSFGNEKQDVDSVYKK
ncbi:unnamed protein product [Acanthosepion pharaonis]|uniref:Uncharacterized protein n=1 Tax=Acanthosepion pharaonis TaxID=158019 RepID=A0A812CS50_ACAPH|nr:unnamed protein product [Sepia pharaonis]